MLEPLALIFKLNNNLIARSLEGLSDEEAWAQPTGSGNPIAWLLGHLTEARAGMLTEMGMPFTYGWTRVFQRGSALQDRSGYPTRAAIETAWTATHATSGGPANWPIEDHCCAQPTVVETVFSPGASVTASENKVPGIKPPTIENINTAP